MRPELQSTEAERLVGESTGFVWRPASPASATLVLVHGLQSHAGWFVDAGPRLAARGLAAAESRVRVPQEDALFSRDPDVLAWIGADTLGARSVTARCLGQINRMLRELRTGVHDLDVPVLVLEASRDRLSDNARNRR